MSCVTGYELDCSFLDKARVSAKMDLTDRKEIHGMRKQTLANGKWDNWLKPTSIAVGAVNMGLNIGAYSKNMKDIRARTNYVNAQKNDLEADSEYKRKVRIHNRRVMK